MGKPFWKTVNFLTFWSSCFYSLERRFFVLEYRKKTFSWPTLRKKSWKNGHVLNKTMGKPFWKTVNFLTFWTSCFYNPERRFFVLKYPKSHFPGLYCLKKKVGKMAIFGPKPWVNPFRKMSVFWTSCFYSPERRFFVLAYRKRHFPGLYCLRRKVEKMVIFGSIPWVNPFGKTWIFQLF